MNTKIAVAGDWHGNLTWSAGRLMSLGAKHPDIDVLLHLGDFGLWPGHEGRRFLKTVEKTASRAGVEVWVTPGNHEDYGLLVGLWMQPENRDEHGEMLPLRLTEHVTVLPRGHRFEMGERSFVSLGGAPSVDFDLPHRREGATWWPEEAITTEDVARTAVGGHAEVMIAHDSPERPWMTPAVEQICHGEPDPDEIEFGWSPNALAYARIGRERLTEAFLAVSPRLLLHGHYHVRSTGDVELPNGDKCRIEALHRDGVKGNVVLLDLETLTVEDA